MANYVDLWDLLYNDQFMHRVFFAQRIAALAVIDENPSTPNHANRLDWANKCILGQLIGDQRQTMVRVCASPEVQAQGFPISDATLQTVVNGLIDFMVRIG